MHAQLLTPSHAALGRAARVLRARHQLSQEAVEHRGGPHRNYVGAVERAETNPTYSTLVRLAAGLGVPLSALILLAEQIAEAEGI